MKNNLKNQKKIGKMNQRVLASNRSSEKKELEKSEGKRLAQK